MDALLVDDHIKFSMMCYFSVGIHWMGMILDSGCNTLRHYNLWMHSGHDGRKTIIRVAQNQCDGSFLRIACDPRISVGDTATVATEARAGFCQYVIRPRLE